MAALCFPRRRGTAGCWRGHYGEHALVGCGWRSNDWYMSSPAMPTPGISDPPVRPTNDNGAQAARAAPAPPIDEKKFRAILGRFTTGVVAVTALRRDDAMPVGLAVNSFTSV